MQIARPSITCVDVIDLDKILYYLKRTLPEIAFTHYNTDWCTCNVITVDKLPMDQFMIVQSKMDIINELHFLLPNLPK